MDRSVGRNIEWPRDDTWAEILRFIVQSMDCDDPSLAYCASLLGYAMKNKGLTKKQAQSIDGFMRKYLAKIEEELQEEQAIQEATQEAFSQHETLTNSTKH